MSPLYDAHNHLHDAWLTPHREQIFADLASVNVRACVVNGTSESDWPAVAALCSADFTLSSGLSALRLLPSFGLHPWDAGNRTPHWQKNLLTHLDAHSSHSPPFIGEIGLDRWMLDRARPDEPRLAGLRRAPIEEQLEVFLFQLSLAAERNLPVSIHCLDAFGLLHDTLRAAPRPTRGFLLHAYSGSAEMVPAFAKLGAYFSFNAAFLPALPSPPSLPPVHPTPSEKCHIMYDTSPKHLRRLAAFRAIPADRLLVETDAPAMPPSATAAAALRPDSPATSASPSQKNFTLPNSANGQPVNHPANLALAYAGLAEWLHSPPEELAARVEKNFRTLFDV